MIIVSQNKKEIINFDNVISIGICEKSEFEEDEAWLIGCSTNGAEGMYYDLGYYKTEERAKEVLNEIAKRFSISKVHGGYEFVDMITKTKHLERYEMPEE